MRELKFRAWVARYKKYMPIISITWDTSNRLMLIKCEDTFGDSFVLNSEDVLLEQYTGLKDKNGKEIYEGDILMTPDGKLIEIGWNNTYARFGYHGITEGYNAFTSLGKCRVIGNIHENPELLEE